MTRSRRGPRPRAPLALIALAATAAAAAPPPSGTIPVADGVQLAYRTVGDGTETVVIPMVVEQQVEWMAPLATGRRLIFYNPRGRGRSTAIDPKLVSYANELADLEQVREFFGLERLALLGWSHYGMMTTHYALQHPDRVTRVLQLHPASPRSDPYLEQGMAAMNSRVDAAAWDALQARRKAGELEDPAADCRAEKRVMFPAFVGDPAIAARLPVDDCDLPNEQGEAQGKWWGALFPSMGTWDLRPQLRASRVPRLVIAGDRDFIPMAASREWVEGMPESRLLVLEGVGHWAPVEARQEFLGAASEFLAGRWPARSAALPAPAQPAAEKPAPAASD